MAYIRWLHRGSLPRELVGGKGAALSRLLGAGFAVPAGFCITADAYRHFARESGLATRLAAWLAEREASAATATAAAEGIASHIASSPLPPDLRGQIGEAYDELSAMAGLACAVRSSAVSEDSAGASFAGLYESYLNVRGISDVVDAVRRCYASLWSERAVAYRARRGGSAEEAMGLVVMALVPSETSGIAFSAHPVTGARDVVVINASWGLGEAIVSGRVTPDSYVVRKQPLTLLEREIFPKRVAVYPHPDGGGTIERTLSRQQAAAASLSDDQACEVARLAARVEDQYAGPQDIEWAISGGQVFLLQARPITTL